MSRWTHPQCLPCWNAANPGRQPFRLLTMPETEQCCWCGHQTEAGIYVRADPAALPHHGEHD